MSKLATLQLEGAIVLSNQQQKSITGGDWYTDCAAKSIELDRLHDDPDKQQDWAQAWVAYKNSGCPQY